MIWLPNDVNFYLVKEEEGKKTTITHSAFVINYLIWYEMKLKRKRERERGGKIEREEWCLKKVKYA